MEHAFADLRGLKRLPEFPPRPLTAGHDVRKISIHSSIHFRHLAEVTLSNDPV
jgi:hypothetical protein